MVKEHVVVASQKKVDSEGETWNICPECGSLFIRYDDPQTNLCLECEEEQNESVTTG